MDENYDSTPEFSINKASISSDSKHVSSLTMWITQYVELVWQKGANGADGYRGMGTRKNRIPYSCRHGKMKPLFHGVIVCSAAAGMQARPFIF